MESSSIPKPHNSNHPQPQSQSQPQQHFSQLQDYPSDQQYQPTPPQQIDQSTQYGQVSSFYPAQQPRNGSATPGIDPAAAAAAVLLSQLAQFTGNIVPAGVYGPGAFHSSAGQSPYRGGGRRGGRRGGRAFRGKKKGNFAHHQPPGCPPVQGGQHDNSVSKDNPGAESSADADSKLTTEGSKPVVTSGAEAACTQNKTANNQQGPQHAWCDLCKVSCTSLETFEQHKIGKRHQKNLRKMLGPEANAQPVNGVECETKGPQLQGDAQQGNCDKLTEQVPPELGGSKMEIKPHNHAVECPQDAVESSQDLQANSQSAVGISGMKRKPNDKRGGKSLKKKNKIPKVIIPLMCDLCNVKCDTKEVLDRHLSGKKHLSKFKRFQGHKAMYGQVGLQALYPPNPIAQTALQSLGYQQPSVGSQRSNPPSEINAPHPSEVSISTEQTERHNL